VPASVPKTTRSVPQISVADDIIAIKNAASLVAAQFHGHAFRNPRAAGIREKSFEDIISLMEKFGGLSPSADRQLHVCELREELREQQPFAHAARCSDAFSQR
jgi:hypothetical protein